MLLTDHKRLKALSLNEKKATLIVLKNTLITASDKAQISAMDSIVYLLEAEIKDQQITTILDEVLK